MMPGIDSFGRRLSVIAVFCLAGVFACASHETRSESRDPVSAGGVVVPREAPTSRSVFTEVRLGPYPVAIEVAADAASRGRGLSGRSTLALDHGMLFAYSSEAERSFWMKDCLIALDIAYVDSAGLIFQIESAEPPAVSGEVLTVTSVRPARYVVEMAKGWFANHGLAAGTKMVLSSEARRMVERAE